MESDQPVYRLGLGSAIKAFLCYELALLVGGLVGGLLGGFLIGITYAGQTHQQLLGHIAEHHALLIGFGTLLGMLLVVAYIHRMKQIPGLNERVGFLPGPPQYRGYGILWGSVLAISYLLASAAVVASGQQADGQGELSKLASENLLIWAVFAIGFAPWVEEHIFRGLMFSGLSARWGNAWGAALVTILFVALHYGEWSHFPIAAVFITSLALVAVRLRVLTNSIQPGIYVHLGYNATLAAVLGLTQL